MTIQAKPMPLDAAVIDALAERRAEPDWLRELRRSWWARAEATPFPTGQEEEWRRTLAEGAPARRRARRGRRFRPELPDVRLADRGVVFTDLASAVRDHPELLRRWLGVGEPVASHAAFWSLSLAAWTGGTFLYVPAGGPG